MATKYAGRTYLVKISMGGSPDEYSNLTAVRDSSLSINNEPIDVTDKDDDAWRKLMAGGVQSIDVSCSGLISNSTVFDRLLNVATSSNPITSFQIVFSDTRSCTCQFHVSSVELAGPYNDAQTYSFTLASANTPTFDTTA